ncbi:MAG: beta-ketoacyl-ACP synthase II [Kiritimatiellia bacterium]|nr:beta-ketoacyl-ACP synthase II [Lentisphaerota bacterium]
MRKVVVTGIGVVSPLGSQADVFWRRSLEGVSGIRRVQQFDCSRYPSQIGGEVVEFNVDDFMGKKDQRRTDRYSQFAIGAARLAVDDSGLDFSKEDPERSGAIVGSGIGGLQTLQTQHSILRDKGPNRCSPFMIPQMISNMAAGLIAIEHNLKGPNYAVVTACATAAHAMGCSLNEIRLGNADMMLAGGADACLCDLGYAGFCALRALSTRNEEPEKASRPFDAERDGFVMSEGAGVLVLEELEHAQRRGARIYCELAGYGATCDAFHETAPEESGDGGARAMSLAIKGAGANVADVGYINAHGTSTKLNDACETRAIKKALGEHARRVMVSSTKSMTGHLLGAAGGVEAAICAMALKNKAVPPTINYTTPDPDCDLDYVPNVARETPGLKFVLSNSLGFGGHNATLAFRAV